MKAWIKGTRVNLIDRIQYLYRMYILERCLDIVPPSRLFTTPVSKMTKSQIKVAKWLIESRHNVTNLDIWNWFHHGGGKAEEEQK